MKNLFNKVYIKKILCNKPMNVVLTELYVKSYEDVIKMFNNYKITKNAENNFINTLFSMHIENNNHMFLYHSVYKNNCLIMSKYNNNYYNCTIPYLECSQKMKNLKNTNFIAYYE